MDPSTEGSYEFGRDTIQYDVVNASVYNRNLLVLASDRTLLYFAKSSLAVNTPDLLLIEGDRQQWEQEGQPSEREDDYQDRRVFGASKFRGTQRKTIMSVGPPDRHGTEYEEMSMRTTVSKYRFEANLPENERVSFEWRRTHGKELQTAGGSTKSFLNRKLIDTRTNRVIALYVKNHFNSMNNKKLDGRIILEKHTAEFGEKWKILFFLSLLSIILLAKRRAG